MFDFVTNVGVPNYGILPNVWLGVTVVNQVEADEKIPFLLQIPAAVRWISIEPMLSAIDLNPWLSKCSYYCDHDSDGGGHRPEQSKIDWVLVGGETGPGAREMKPEWAISVKDQCQDQGVPFFFKNHGSYYKLGKPTSRLLEGKEWNELPEV